MKSRHFYSALMLTCASFFGLQGALLAQQADTSSESDSKTISMEQLLEQVKQGNRQDQQTNAQRISDFRANLAEQQALLRQVQQQRADAENLSQQREMQFEENEQKIMLQRERLNERLGALKELFGVMQLVANDAQGQFDNSLIQIHFPERTARLAAFSQKMGQTTELPSIQEIEALWYELQREMIESGKVVKSTQTVLTADGQEQQKQLIRIGTFNLVADGKYFDRIAETGRIVEFPRQPSRRYMDGAEALAGANGQLLAFTIDPVRGQLISLLGATPNLLERVQQGGVIGIIILSLGAVVVLLAVGRYLLLWIEDRKIQNQIKSLDSPGNNALGRVLRVYQSNKAADVESLELKLGEAVLREVPRINRGLPFLKISAAIAPLLGLLGTVTGMIITFQAITLFGAGDPKLMAGGISQALVTTVLGLVVAIPTLFLHNLLQGKASKISEVIEQEAVALVAMQAENKG